jgi:hypothetical protein
MQLLKCAFRFHYMTSFPHEKRHGRRQNAASLGLFWVVYSLSSKAIGVKWMNISLCPLRGHTRTKKGPISTSCIAELDHINFCTIPISQSYPPT